MSQRRLTSDQNGNIYAVTDSGDLLHNGHPGGDPTKQLLYAGIGRRIPAQLKDFEHWLSWSGQPADPAKSHFAFIRSDGMMLYNRVEGLSTAAPSLKLSGLGSPVPVIGGRAGIGQVGRIFCDKAGTVYWLSTAGVLSRAQLTVVGDQASLKLIAGNLPIPGLTDVLHLLSAGPGRLFIVAFTGHLRYIEEVSSGTFKAYDVSDCWNTAAVVFAAGDGGIYSTTAEGDLRYTRVVVSGGQVTVTPPGYGVRVGQAVCHAVWDLPPTIEGYCWPLCAAPGEKVEFKVSVTDAAAAKKPSVSYGVRYLRLRIPIRSRGGRFVESFEPEPKGSIRGNQEARHLPRKGQPWMNGCGWVTAFDLTIPNDGSWPSGLYAAECCPVGAGQPEVDAWYVVFIVKPAAPDPAVPLAVLAHTNTWNAYNCWGGKSKYHCYVGNALPQRLSFERPNPGTCPSELQTRDNAMVRGMTACGARAEAWVLTWLEANGYPFHLYSDGDLDRGIEGISQGPVSYSALILNTHPEYWTTGMRDNLDAYLKAGGSVIYLGGNGLYEQVELSPDRKVMLVLQRASAADLEKCNCDGARQPTLWRNLGRPESDVLGVGFTYEDWPNPKTSYDVQAAKHPFLAGITDAQIGTVGYHGPASQWELDVSEQNPPNDIVVLARGTNDAQYPYGGSMVYRQYGPNAKNFVFSAGSLGFGSSLVVDPTLQRVLKNALSSAGIVSVVGAPVVNDSPVLSA